MSHRTSLITLVCLIAAVSLVPVDRATAQAPGGFVEPANSVVVRPLLTAAQIQSFVPARGRFTFLAPYLTEASRLTNSTDCGGSDCVHPVGYSYWRNTNNHVGSNTMYVFLTLARNKGGGGPTLFAYDKTTGAVTKVGSLFDASHALSWASGEGWYFSATRPHALYLNDGSTLKRYDVLTKQLETVFDVASAPGLFGSNRIVWQLHSSSDDRVHSGTLKDRNTYAELGCFAYREDTKQFSYYPRIGAYDECQVDKSGRYLIIKENVDGRNGEDNRIIDLTTSVERRLLDENGAGGHSDNGHGFMLASDNWANQANALKVWRLGESPLQGTLVYYTQSWDAPAPNHVSLGNSANGVPPEQQYGCGSGANSINAPRANEIICFPLDGTMRVLVVAPVMTDMSAPGGGDSYSKLPKGNLDVTGQYFVWTSNLASGRLDAFVVRVPSHLLTGVPPPPPPPLPYGAPQNLTSTVAGPTITLTWTAPGGSPSPTSYVIEAASRAGESDLVRGFNTNSTATTFTASAPAGTYFVRVKALYGLELSAASNEVVVVVGARACSDGPAAPSGLRAGVASSLVSLTWNASGSDVTSHVLAAGSLPGLTNLGSVETGNATTTFAGRIPRGRYFISVRGRNACGLGAPAEVMVDVP